MNGRRWLAFILGLLVVAGGVALYLLPELVRRTAIARIGAMTERPAAIDRVEVNVFTGRVGVHGFRLTERDGQTPFADFKRLDLRLHLPALLLGHLLLREVVLSDPTVRVVRLPTGEFNFTDMIHRSGTSGAALDVTVERFRLTGGTTTLEDQALPERRTWTSEGITIDARNVSTRRDDGHAVGRSVTGGAPVSVEVTDLRLHPVRLQATVTVEGLDLTPAQVYLPPDAPAVLSGGRASMSVAIGLDAREGLRGDATGRFEDVAVVGRDGGEPLARVPGMTTRISGFALREGALHLAQLAVDGTIGVRDPLAKQGAPLRISRVRASVADLTWPATTPGRLDLQTSIPGGGSLAVTGTIQPPPVPSQLRLRLANLDLAPWTQFLPVPARVTGVAEADLRVNEPLAAGIPARVHGTIAVNGLGVADRRQEVLRARRIQASGLELQWPTRVVIGRVLVTEPRGTIERDHAGGLSTRDILGRPADVSPAPAEPVRAAPALGVDVREIVVRDGAIAWRDHRVSPPARLDVSSIEGRVTGAGWPLREWVGVRLALRPPGGGRLAVSGRIDFDRIAADVRLRVRNAELAPYQPYLPTTARVGGAADADLAVTVHSLTEGRATARGSAALSRVDVRDREQTVLRIERAEATGVDVEWPGRVAVGHLALTQPWVVIERDDTGVLSLRALVLPSRSGSGAVASTPVAHGENGRAELPVTVNALSVDGGGMRIVDRAVTPAFAVDFQPVTLRIEHLSTISGKPARLDLTGRLGPGAELALRGTVGGLGGPLTVALAGELREFAVPRANPYMLQHAGWKTTEGRLTSRVEARVEGDALSAQTEIRLSRLQLVRAAPEDGAQTRIGLPLNVLTALMKDRHGDITVAFPVGGRLSDPQFDFSEALWSAVRTVAIRAITLPVSWIGRVHFTPDSRIEGIELDPVLFEPGSPALTGDGQAHASRLAGFLEELPDVRLALTPVISSEDVDALKRRALEKTVQRVAREQRLSAEAATTVLFEQAFPDRPTPDSLETMLGALLSREPAPTTDIPQLGTHRLEALRDAVARSGIDGARLSARKLVRRDPGSRIELDILEPETKTKGPSKVRDTLERLGVPLRGD